MSKGRATTRPTIREDRFEPTKAGQIDTTIGGVPRRLRRPTIGEQRRWVEAITELSELEAELKAKREANTPEGESPPVGRIPDVDAGLLGWWRDVIDTLSEDDADPLPDDDDLPPWLLQGSLITETRNHWQTVPWGPGGSPSQQQAEAVAPALAQALEALARGSQPTS